MTLLVKDANTTVQSLATEVDGNGNLVPVHAPATTNAQGVSTTVDSDCTAVLASLTSSVMEPPINSQ